MGNQLNILWWIVLLPRLFLFMCRPSVYRQTVYGQCRPGNREINTDIELCVRFKYEVIPLSFLSL